MGFALLLTQRYGVAMLAFDSAEELRAAYRSDVERELRVGERLILEEISSQQVGGIFRGRLLVLSYTNYIFL
jgi:hypothetical protein